MPVCLTDLNFNFIITQHTAQHVPKCAGESAWHRPATDESKMADITTRFLFWLWVDICKVHLFLIDRIIIKNVFLVTHAINLIDS